MPKTYIYHVITSRSVVDEMARYDGARAEIGEFVGLGSIRPVTDEAEARAKCRDEAERDTRLLFHWRLTSDRAPCICRWASFGVGVRQE